MRHVYALITVLARQQQLDAILAQDYFRAVLLQPQYAIQCFPTCDVTVGKCMNEQLL